MALEIPINLKIENIAEMGNQVARMTGGGAGAGGARGGSISTGGLFGGEGGAGAATAKGLGQIAKQLPGVGVLESMGGAFKQGGLIGVGMAGVAGILGFVKQIFESSNVFKGVATSFFKIFGAMADMFLLPFLPLAMRGMQQLLKWMPEVQAAGQKVADWLQRFIDTWTTDGLGQAVKQHIQPAMMEIGNKIAQQISFGLVKEKDYKYDPESGEILESEVADDRTTGQRMEDTTRNTGRLAKWGGFGLMGLGAALAPVTGGASLAAIPLGAKLAIGGMAVETATNKFAGTGEGRQFSPVIKRGDQVGGLGAIEGGVGSIMNSMEVSLARQAEKVNMYATEFQQKEVGAGGVLAKWDDEVLRGSIPQTWDSITGMYSQMDEELANEAKMAEVLAGRVPNPAAGFDPGLDQVANEIGAALNSMTMSDFVLDPGLAAEVENCFIIANQCINTKWQNLGELVESGVEMVQFGVGGQIMDLEGIESLVAAAQSMGPSVAAEANAIAADVALMVQQMSDSTLDLTVDPQLLAERIKNLNTAVDSQVIDTATQISGATSAVNAIAQTWRDIELSYATNTNIWDYAEEFGTLGSNFGDAATNAASTINRMKGRRVKRRRQIKPKVAVSTSVDDEWEAAGLNEGMYEDATYEEIGGTTDSGSSYVEVTTDDDFSFSTNIETLGAWDDYVEAGSSPAESAPATNYATSTNVWDYAEEFGSLRSSRGRGGVHNTSRSTMNINIHTNSSLQDVLGGLRNIQSMDDASFFNSVN